MKTLVYIIFAVIIIIAALAVKNTEKYVGKVACTEEAKLCPDGSAVGRVGPKCEFAACPESISATSSTTDNLIRVDLPVLNAEISSPVLITGEARGTWYFEASFPIVIVDWDGRIIGEGHAEAKSDWMTSEYVPFEATVKFIKPADQGPQSVRGAIILKNDNPSGMASTSYAIEIPIRFE